MNTRNKILCFICAVSLLLASFLTIIDKCCFDKSFYYKTYEKLNTAETAGLSNEDLNTVTDLLLDYLQGKVDSLDYKTRVNYSIREIFNTREKLHMVDVKNLYLNAMTVRNISFVIFLVSLFIIYFTKAYTYLYREYKIAILILLFIFICIGIACLIDFNSFWISFHEVFFDNDLYLLNPKTDILIMLVPEEFFFTLVIKIIIYNFIFDLATFFLLKVLDKKVINV